VLRADFELVVVDFIALDLQQQWPQCAKRSVSVGRPPEVTLEFSEQSPKRHRYPLFVGTSLVKTPVAFITFN
jgi:hypothetical protein